MEASSELVADARHGRSDAIERLLALHYPTVWRMATGLTGRSDVGRGVARYVMRRSLRALPNWNDGAAATRWFHHHTLLTTRRTDKHAPDLRTDSLLRQGSDDAGYIAFVRALRSLPIQQREAFILTRLEGFGARNVAVAMDCSTIAAENHLMEAQRRLRELAGSQFNQQLDRMISAYQSIDPDEALSIERAKANIHRMMLSWRAMKTIKLVASFALLLITVWGSFWIWRIVQHSMQE